MLSRWASTDDGSKILYRILEGDKDGVPVVITGGLGGTHMIWSALAKRLRAKHDLVIWEYPGLPNGEPGEGEVSVERLANFQKAVFDHAQIDRAILLGWSLGPQVNLEFASRHEDSCAAQVAICGVSGKPFKDTSDEPIAEALGLRSSVPDAVGWLATRIERIETLKTYLRRTEHPTRWAKRLGFVALDTDEIVFDAIIRDFIALPPRTYGQYVQAAAAHDGTGLLGSLGMPLLAIAGSKDRLIPASRVSQMADLAKKSEFLLVKGASHFCPIEFPELLSLKIEDFLKRYRIK